jgi:UDP-N-acetylglucosamine 2-epimerase
MGDAKSNPMVPRYIALWTSDRSEHGLLEPVMEALGKINGVRGFWLEVNRSDVYGGYARAAEIFMSDHYILPHISLVPCDRAEMVGVALYLYYHNHPFAQLHAGDTGSDSHDELGRFVISRCASLLFCNSPESAYTLRRLGEEEWRILSVGSTAFDDIKPDYSLVPGRDFDLLLIQPDQSSQQTSFDMQTALDKLDKYTVAIGPNKDDNANLVTEALLMYHYRPNAVGFEYHSSVLRPTFLGLMEKCKRFITNSSSALYELPRFGIDKWVAVGKRNADRKPLTEIITGASVKIADVLANTPLDEKLVRKKWAL